MLHEKWAAEGKYVVPWLDALSPPRKIAIAKCRTYEKARLVAEALNALDRDYEPPDMLAREVWKAMERWVSDRRIKELVGTETNKANLALSASLTLAFSKAGYDFDKLRESSELL